MKMEAWWCKLAVLNPFFSFQELMGLHERNLGADKRPWIRIIFSFFIPLLYFLPFKLQVASTLFHKLPCI